MSWLALVLLLHVADPAVVQPGETLDRVAERLLGDAHATSELKALNPGLQDAPAPGTHLTLPGPERTLAISALSTAQHAVDQSPSGAERDRAAQNLAHARELFAQAHYREAANAADSAWKQLTNGDDASTHFAVDVQKDGTTQVSAKSGQPIRVESEGKMVALSAGQTVQVRKGEAPELVMAPPPPQLVEALAVPRLLSPADNHKLSFKSAGALGPVRLTWTPVHGAQSYEVGVKPVHGDQVFVLTSKKASAVIPSLPPGRYRWTVKALGTTGASAESRARVFELLREDLRLNVHTSKWK